MKQLTIVLFLMLTAFFSFAQNEVEIYDFKIEKVGKGSPVILIPGLSCSGEVWKETVDSLEQHYECHVLTLPGFSKEKPISIENGFLNIVEGQILDYIQKKLMEKPIIIGHSLGGFLGMSLASQHSDKIEKLVIVDSYPFYSAAFLPTATEENVKGQAAMMKDMLLNTTEEAFEAQQKMTMPSMMNDEDKMALAIQWSLESDRATVAEAMYEIMTTDLRDEVGNIECPILVYGSWYAGKDYGITAEMTFDNYKNQFSKAKDCTIEIAKTGRHFVMWDEPVWFRETLIDFLK